MPDDDQPPAQPLSIPEPGRYILAGEIGFAGLVAPRAGMSEAARIRLTIDRASILDLPVSQNTLAALSRSLIPKIPPEGWRQNDDE